VLCLKRFGVWSRDKRALSPIFATVLLATIIIIFGSAVFYFANNITTTTTNDYVKTVSNSQQAIAERVSFENVVYISTTKTLTVSILNSGSANNLKLNSLLLYNGARTVVDNIPDLSTNPNYALKNIETNVLIQGNILNVGKEAYFTVTLGTGLPSGSIYTIHLITQSGSSFDYDFTA
jgi:hypothetical protein